MQADRITFTTTVDGTTVTYSVGGDSWALDLEGFGVYYEHFPNLNYDFLEILDMLPPARRPLEPEWWRYSLTAPNRTSPPIRVALHPHSLAEPVGARIEWEWVYGATTIEFREIGEHRARGAWRASVLEDELRLTDVHRYPLGPGPFWIRWEQTPTPRIVGWAMLPEGGLSF